MNPRNQRVRTKICGITRADDARAAAAAGVDAIGLVFVPKSRRCVSCDQAVAVCDALPPFVGRVGLFMDADAAQVESVLERVGLDWLQFHGNESAAFCRQFRRPWIKALAMNAGQPASLLNDFAGAAALLLDSHAGGELGGTGQVFDWSRVPAMERPWILAGGLHPGNVAEACQRLRPDAVDVSSGVETEPGIKDHTLMNDFLKAVHDV